jgi:aerobic C4-dicarboxylate transport protein
MKIWLKLLIGAVVGVLLAVILPATTGIISVFDFLSELFVRIGRFMVFPMVFFSLCIGTYELTREKRTAAVYRQSVVYLLGACALLAVIGVLSCVIVSPTRIPIPVEEAEPVARITLPELLLSLFPANLFTVFSGSADVMLPLMVLGIIIGFSMDFDNVAPRVLIQIADSLSRTFYHINALVSEVIAIGLIALSASLILELRLHDLSAFRQLITILSVDTIVVVFGVFPLLLYWLGDKEPPYRWVYAALGPAIAGFVSGDVTLALGQLTRHGKESFGVPRTVGSAVYPLAAFFGRAGTALVSGVTFVLILRSYSSLELGILEVLWVMLMTFLVSLILGSAPGSGTLVALSVLCSLYGKGRQDGFLIVKPVMPLLVAYGAFLDVLTAAFTGLLVGRTHPEWKNVEAKDFL